MKKRETDEAHKWTDRKLEDIEKELHDIYKEAQDDLQKKWDEALEILDKKASKFREEYEALKKEGKKKEARAKLKEYQQALNKAKSENHYRTMLEQISSDLTRVNERALAYINNQLPQVYLKNYNYIGKAVEDEMEGHSFNMSFNLVNEHAVKELYKKMPQKVVKVAKDRAWNNKHINSQLMQGILQGESIPKIAERFKNVVGMDERASVREARTLTTQAENLGRLESLKSLDSDYGIISMKMWIATADDHTRASHLDLDGETMDLGEKFSNGLMFPADPDGEPAEVYNCRCTMIKVVTGLRNLDGTITPFEYEDERRKLHRNAIEAEKAKRQREAEEKAKRREEKRMSKEGYKNPDNLQKSVLDVIGYPGAPKDPVDAMREVNPHRDDWRTDSKVSYAEYRRNCQRCAPAYELSRRGYDVEAKRFDGNYPSWMDVFETKGYAKDVDNWVASQSVRWFGNPDHLDAPKDVLRTMGRGPKGATKTIKEAMNRWGEGSRAVMCVQWKGGGGHIVNVENVGGKVVIYDSQVNKSTDDIESYLKSTVANHTELCRVDHLDIREEMNDKFREVVKKRKND